jgi:hypothetical protein
LSCSLAFSEFVAELAQARIEVLGGLTDAVFDLGVVIRAEEILLLPLVGLFADVEDLESHDMPSFGHDQRRIALRCACLCRRARPALSQIALAGGRALRSLIGPRLRDPIAAAPETRSEN